MKKFLVVLHKFTSMNHKILLLCSLLLLFSCKKTDTTSYGSLGTVKINFTHTIDSAVLTKNTLMYHNAAGNLYEVDELKYFISELTLYANGISYSPAIAQNVHYVDLDISSTLTWEISSFFPVGHYDSISFIFGLNEIRNVTNYFHNPPEINMFWPDILGGGYHYMMLNGKWRKPDNTLANLNFHMGMGQLYSGTTFDTDSITGYVSNFFRVGLPSSSFNILKDSTTEITLQMNINKWFTEPHVYDFNYWGPAIMQNQAALNTIKENGWNVFSCTSNH
jgi:hypothetical protein